MSAVIIMDPEGNVHVLHRRLRNAVQLYNKCLQEHPILTKAVTSGLLAGLGDLTVQCLLSHRHSHHKSCQLRSVVSVTAFGMAVTGPGMHFLHNLLEAFSPHNTSVSVLKKVVLDRLIVTPPYLLFFFYIVALLEKIQSIMGRSLSAAWKRAWSVFWSALLCNWAVWGPAQYINLSYVPLKYRVLFMNATSFVWNIYTALLRRK